MTPSTLSPSALPTQAPTTKVPSFSPTKCIPGNVTCCFTAQEQVVQLFVNEQDLTDFISPQSGLSDASVAKVVTFVEPSGPAMFALKGFENNEIKTAALFLICTCTRPGSEWNFVTTSEPAPNLWKSVASLSISFDQFPLTWNSNFNLTDLSLTSGKLSSEPINLNTNLCGIPSSLNKLKANQGVPPSKFWTLRRFVNQTMTCGTSSPFSPPPPRTGVPSFVPTLFPTFFLPTLSPTMSAPSLSPVTSKPSNSPTKRPSTSAPSVSPVSCVPGQVTCCVSFDLSGLILKSFLN